MHIRIFALAMGLMGVCMTWNAMATEEPKYQTLRQEGDFEIRRYAPILIAETTAEGDMDAASNTGFRRIADFIFGNNRAASSDASAKIGMTAPVAVEPQALTSMQSVMQWRIHFVMPSHYTLATLPQPNNPLVQIKELPAKTFVVHRYSGFNTISRVQIKTDETLAWMQREGLRALGTPQLSRYDPPWTLPMFRRNEIWVEIEAPNANSKN